MLLKMEAYAVGILDMMRFQERRRKDEESKSHLFERKHVHVLNSQVSNCCTQDTTKLYNLYDIKH